MNQYATCLMMVGLIVTNSLYTCYAGCSGKQLLNETFQGQQLKIAFGKFEDEVVDKVEKDRMKLATQEQECMKLQREIEEQMEVLQKAKASEGKSVSFDQQEEDIQDKIRLLQSKQRHLLPQEEKFKFNVEQAKAKIQKKYQQDLMVFDQDVLQRYAPLHGWDVMFLKEGEGVMYMSDRLNKSKVLVDDLHKQVDARKKEYKTVEDVKQLFNNLGIIYLDKIRVDQPQLVQIDVKHTSFYEDNKHVLDSYAKYKDLVEKGYRANICVKWVSDKVGFGIYALSDIKEGEMIQEYTGVLRCLKKWKGMFADDMSYAWRYPLGNQYNEETSIDSKFEGNEMRFVNHSNHPNVNRSFVLGDDNLLHCCYIALYDIKAGEQLFIDYGSSYWASREYEEL